MNNKNEVKKETSKLVKFREIITYIWLGFLLGLNILLGYFLIINRAEYFGFNIDFTRSIELGFLILKMILLIVIVVVNFKSLGTVQKEWRKANFIKKEEKREGIEEIKRIWFGKRWWFMWRVYGARNYMDKYHEMFMKLKKSIGKIRGNETKELEKCKREIIKGVLIWTDDFQITQIERDKRGNEITTNKPVTKEFLEQLYLEEIYEDYLIRCVDAADKFVNGHSEIEREMTI